MQLRAPGFRAIAVAKWTSHCTSVSFFYRNWLSCSRNILNRKCTEIIFFQWNWNWNWSKEYNYFSCSPVAKNDHMKPSSTMRNVLKRARHYAILASVFSLIQIFLYLFYLYIYFWYVYTSHSWLHERALYIGLLHTYHLYYFWMLFHKKNTYSCSEYIDRKPL